jgi:hypothetical protein
MPRALCTTLAVLLLGTMGLGCQSLSGKKNSTLPPNGPVPPAPPNWDPLTPPAFPPPSHQAKYAPGPQVPGLLAPHAEVSWSIASQQGKPIPVMSGKSTIGPDGTVILGPYGQYQIGGMSLTQASQFIEQRLGKFLINPRVQLQVLSHNQFTNMTWTATSESGLTPVSGSEAGWGTEQQANYTGPSWGQNNVAPR